MVKIGFTNNASLPSLIQFLPGSFRSSLWNFHRSSLPCLMHRWAVGIFQLHRRSHPSLRSSRRHLWIHSTSVTTGQFQTSPSSRSSLSVPPTSKSLDIWSVTIYSRRCNQPTRNTRSTETATIKVMSDIYRAADAGLVTLLGLLDLSAAFDTVDHVNLLGSTSTPLRHLRARAQVDRVLPDGAISVRSFQR